jgi:hypothetical protein
MKASVVRLASIISKRMINVNIWHLEYKQMEKEEMENDWGKLAKPKYEQQPVQKGAFQSIIEEMAKMEMEVEKLFKEATTVNLDYLNSSNLQLKNQ